MTTPEERERRKYRWQQTVRDWRIFKRIYFWAPIAFFGALFLLMALFAKR